jgi:2'-5' RNA ligase
MLQVYAPVDLSLNPGLADLIPRWRAAAGDAPVALVGDEWLHVTLEAVTDATAQQIDAGERRDLAAALRGAVAGIPVYQGRAGSALAYQSGILLDVSPAAPLVELHQRIRAAVHKVRGKASTAFRVGKPHVSLGYATADADSDPLQRALRAVDPNGAPLRLAEVALVEVRIDQRTGQLAWDTLDIIALTTA